MFLLSAITLPHASHAWASVNGRIYKYPTYNLNLSESAHQYPISPLAKDWLSIINVITAFGTWWDSPSLNGIKLHRPSLGNMGRKLSTREEITVPDSWESPADVLVKKQEINSIMRVFACNNITFGAVCPVVHLRSSTAQMHISLPESVLWL